MVTTNQKPIVDTQKIKRKESKHTTTGNHQITMEETKREINEQRTTKQKTMNKMVIISPYLSIIL